MEQPAHTANNDKLMRKQKLKKKLPALGVGALIIVLMVGLDQWTKWAIVKSIPLNGMIEVIPGFFELTYLRNFGAAFSSMTGVSMGFFGILTIVALCVIAYYFMKTDSTKVEFALSLIAAGAIGNLIDRMTLGYVRDFFRFYIFGSPFAVFNVADVCLTIGVALLIVIVLVEEWKERKAFNESSKSSQSK